MKIFNTLSNKKEKFLPLEKNKVTIYLCGPTVYDFGHLGHGRSAVSFDLIRKYLIYKGYSVQFASNYTDIDDKMIKRANELKISVKELADKIIPEYQKDYALLRIDKPDFQPKATEHIPTIIKIVQTLLDKDFAYKLTDGIYFDVKKFKKYGKLSNQKLDELEAGVRVEINEEKRSHQDFVLWKNAKEGEPSWKSPFGEGRPGWHIECSAMNYDLFGPQIDIHGGGADLTFPHHECEIAQSESFTGRKFVKYWMHNGFIQINNEKMSKSLGNFFTIKEILAKYDSLIVRYFLISTHYRSPINFADNLLEQAKNSLQRITDFVLHLQNIKESSSEVRSEIDNLIKKTKEEFEEAMDNDFEVSKALSTIFDLIKEINILDKKSGLSKKEADKILEFLQKINDVLDIINFETSQIPDEIKQLIELRNTARKNKEWTQSDKIRDQIKEKGYEIEDTKDGVVCKRAS